MIDRLRCANCEEIIYFHYDNPQIDKSVFFCKRKCFTDFVKKNKQQI